MKRFPNAAGPAPPPAAKRVVTWSPSVTLVPTRSCFNACGYCSFRRPPGSGDPLQDALDPAMARRQLQQRPGAAEVLLLSGEVAPDSRHRRRWFRQLVVLSRLALELGRLPHTNAGPLTMREMAALGRVNPSMGLMLEGVGPAHAALHRHAPSKRPRRRLAQLEQAGRLGIPFTTGLLLGVGETVEDRRRGLDRLARLQRRWGHLQEVILQPFRPDGAAATPLPAGQRQDLLGTIRLARAILPPEVHLQLPPNLWPAADLPEALEAGIDDLGGIDTTDVINPAYPQPRPESLRRQLAAAGWTLRPRLCVHAAWLPWLPPDLQRRAAVLQERLLASQPPESRSAP